MPVYELNGIRPELPAPGSCYIAPDATVIGKVKLEEGVSIWFNAVLRGDNEPITIGRRTNIQEGCICHADPGFPLVVGANCTIGHGAILHGCTVSDNCLIGMGVTVSNGAKIGANSLIGANALVTEGKEFPANSLILGMPARAVRTLDDAAVKLIAASAEVYFQRWQSYQKGLRRID
jgi:carbonic anhydrase/acetyltransferase-like protein (isoleucine patch superfamily)